LITFQYV